MSRVGCLEFLSSIDLAEAPETLGRRLRREDTRLHRVYLSERKRLRTLCATERKLWESGCRLVAGADEVGRGPLAGPLVAAAVTFQAAPWIPWLKDSKQLQAEEREQLVAWVKAQAVSIALAVIDVEDINRGNLHVLSLEALKRAAMGLEIRPDHVLIDGRFPVQLEWPQTHIVGGDRKCASIAAASIVAKVARDRMMIELDRVYPGYEFARHKGYATAEHCEALRRLGPCPIHRMTFAPVRDSLQGRLF
ncbi:MAG: ribonuclease HII [Armatimonadetes bacterium]|nr:ribonuclease HII [Armatimonadota bacterium]